ncbi:hypothetical protein DUGA6_36060 [Duganella sp. HH105]|nr:hypothetical protein DUGA6_36060 [Duganella sp. HH105]
MVLAKRTCSSCRLPAAFSASSLARISELLSGVRSSCDIFARNCDLYWLARSSSAARCSRSSCALPSAAFFWSSATPCSANCSLVCSSSAFWFSRLACDSSSTRDCSSSSSLAVRSSSCCTCNSSLSCWVSASTSCRRWRDWLASMALPTLPLTRSRNSTSRAQIGRSRPSSTTPLISPSLSSGASSTLAGVPAPRPDASSR